MKYTSHDMAVMPAVSPHWQQVADIDHLTQFDEEPMDRRDVRYWCRKHGCCWVATNHPDVLAFVMWSLDEHGAYIHRIAVHPYCWQQKIGSWLLDCLRFYLTLNKAVTMRAEVKRWNSGGIEFFVRNGFKVTKQMDDSLVLVLR